MAIWVACCYLRIVSEMKEEVKRGRASCLCNGSSDCHVRYCVKTTATDASSVTPTTLGDGEELLYYGSVIFEKGLFFARVGQLVLTNRRVLWHETPSLLTRPLRPLKPIRGELRLSDIASVDKGTVLDLIGGGVPLRIRLRTGHDKCLWDADGKLDGWVKALTDALKANR